MIMTKKSELDPTAIVAGLAHAGHHVPIFFLEAVDSTMDEARRSITKGNAPPFIVVAGRQLKGRGRMGRVWHGSDPGNFYFTFVFPYSGGIKTLLHLTLWSGEILARYFQEALGLAVYVKLPNDLYSGGRKLAGMLVESIEFRGNVIALGLGLNVNPDRAAWPDDLRENVTSLQELNAKPVPFNRLATVIMGLIIESYAHFTACTDTDTLNPHAFVKERLQVWPNSFSLQ